jgi:hypothetical protein
MVTLSLPLWRAATDYGGKHLLLDTDLAVLL